MRALLLAASLVGMAACFTPTDGDACHVDSDCSGSTCTRVGECASEPYALRVAWTIHGEAANVAGACTSIGDLELSISDPSLGEQYAVRPVPCGAGSFFYDKLPQGFTDVQVTAFSSRGDFLTSTRGSSVGTDGSVTVDLQF